MLSPFCPLWLCFVGLQLQVGRPAQTHQHSHTCEACHPQNKTIRFVESSPPDQKPTRHHAGIAGMSVMTVLTQALGGIDFFAPTNRLVCEY
jgi:hypothetical protein